MSENTLSRRRFLELGCKIGAGAALLGPAAGCARDRMSTTANQEFLKIPFSREDGKVAFGVYQTRSMRKVCEEIVPLISDMKWLKRGDSVFVKIACNSPARHPGVTAPEAIAAMVGFLKDYGAGTVYVGDQSGIEYVRLTPQGRVGSTLDLMARCGQLEAAKKAGATIHCFDDQGWESYHQAESDFKDIWEGQLYLTNILRDVNHIVYLPRLGTHSIAGYTCGIKIAVGWLRDDSRLSLHRGGPLFFHKIAEISHFPVIRKKLRMCVTLADSALLNIGPDFGGRFQFGGTLGMASRSLVDHDYLATSMISWLDAHNVSIYDLYNPYPVHVNFWNRQVIKGAWGEEGVRDYPAITPCNFGDKMENDVCLSHLAALQGYRPAKIAVIKKGDNIPSGLEAHLKGVGGGMLLI